MNNLFLFQTPPVDKTKYVLTLDKLKFEGVIGNGAFGEVSIGIHQPTGLKVAIKKLHSIDDNQRNKELYQREVDCLANLKHRFLLPFVGYTEVPPYCIVTKYIPNGSLYNALHSNTINLDPTDLTLIAYGISAGMQYLHSHKIIHRDLKTQNVLIDENNLPVIADFGSSRKQETSRAMTGLFGTTHYMAPEFIQGEEYNEKVDVYSFGLILWEMLTKKVPFSGLESAQVIYTVVIQQSRPPIPSKTPPNLAKLIECCWSPNANERPSFERITPLFENGTVEFPDCDRQKFNNVYNTFSPQLKLTRRHSNSNLLLNMPMDEIVNNIRMSRDDRNIKSFTNLLPQSYSSNLIQKANELLFSLNESYSKSK
ncbi:Serine/threonine-protein kinase HT1 [Tritrichomonas foetus]|uniref:Serine/threonine-protein kinase HT1 n=1 Tax=Tritrichomonas foetus TaxID=1144522 RepID=A0A1J4JH20_9EUKA|nr:Serine/threonine-protein kinase HT1 [Tritrichomonas foetus]|eukprot:OHS98450.1 Serine/threonine-protein kinase HT1 [Tritrichomonas foetus]